MERLTKIGVIAPKNAKDIRESRMGLGMEKLDRDAFDPALVYDKVAALGVKWIRLQSGWQKTEKEEGVYDFAWLDEQVDELRARGLVPWLCLCYGNALYDELAKKYQGAVGCTPIRTEKAYNAWLAYAKETAKHFAGRVAYYEVWNEPEGGWTWRPAPNPKEYADFCVRTAKAVREGDPNAKIMTGSHYEDSMASFNEEFRNGTLTVSDAVTYHSYHYDETYSMQRVRALKALIASYGGKAEIVQGESGSQSKSGGSGALWQYRTDPQTQTKQIVRHAVADLLAGVKFTSVFSCVDMAENLDAKEGEPIASCGYFGLLGADFDPKTGKLVGDYYEKPSYYAYQNLCSLFCGNVRPTDLAVLFKPAYCERIGGSDCPARELICGGIAGKNGAKAFAYWRSTDLLTVKGYEGAVTFEIAGVHGEARLIDPLDGGIYAIPQSILAKTEGGLYTFSHLPVRDYPLFVTFGDF